MNLRHIVPALGLVALSASAASAQEIATGLFLNGWSDSTLTWGHDASETAGGGSLGAENKDAVDFATAAKLRVDWNVNSQVSARVSIRFNEVGGDAETDGAYLQESFVNIQANDKTSVMMGKFINHLGWQSAEPTGLNRVNYGLTLDYYGNNDPLGASVTYTSATSEKGTIASTFQLTNGYFTAQDGTNDGSVNSNDPALNDHQRNDLGIGADFSFTPNGDKTNVNLEFAYDPASSEAAGGSTLFNGYIFQTGLNGTMLANDKLMVGGEVIYRASQNGVVSSSGPSTKEDIAWMATATQTLDTEEKFFPMAGTVMYSANNEDFRGEANTSTAVEHQLALALLTNPYGSSNFGLNLEYQYGWTEGTSSDLNTHQIALEGLVVIP